MSVNVVIKFIEKFILDVVGVILPGLFLLVGLKCVFSAAISNELMSEDLIKIFNFGDNNFVIYVSLCYICGHGLHVIGDKFLYPLFSKVSRKEVYKSDKLFDQYLVKEFKSLFFKKYKNMASPEGDFKFNNLRSIALAIAPDSEMLTYKFMFISLMNLGIASASLCVGVVSLLLLKINIGIAILCFLLLSLVIPTIFLLKYIEFRNRALTVPFSFAVVKILQEVN